MPLRETSLHPTLCIATGISPSLLSDLAELCGELCTLLLWVCVWSSFCAACANKLMLVIRFCPRGKDSDYAPMRSLTNASSAVIKTAEADTLKIKQE